MFTPHTLWDILAAEGNFDLIDKLRHAELDEDGFHTLIIPDEGFSKSDQVHNCVLDWLRIRGIMAYNVQDTIEYLWRGLHVSDSL